MPGVSSSCMPFFSFSHCFPLVTPGLSPVCALFFPVILFISDDLPTFGTPTIISLNGFCMLRSLFFSSAIFSSIPNSCFTPVPLMQFMESARLPSFLKCSSQLRLMLPSARSLLLSTIIRGLLFTSSSIIGFLLETGILASITSITASTSLRFSCISSRVFFICPGYQLIFSIDSAFLHFFFCISVFCLYIEKEP